MHAVGHVEPASHHGFWDITQPDLMHRPSRTSCGFKPFVPLSALPLFGRHLRAAPVLVKITIRLTHVHQANRITCDSSINSCTTKATQSEVSHRTRKRHRHHSTDTQLNSYVTAATFGNWQFAADSGTELLLLSCRMCMDGLDKDTSGWGGAISCSCSVMVVLSQAANHGDSCDQPISSACV